MFMGAARNYPKCGLLFALTLVLAVESAEAFTADAIFVAISASVLLGGYAIYHRIHRLRKSRHKKAVIFVTNNSGEAVTLHCKSKSLSKIGNYRLNTGDKRFLKFQASRNMPLLCNFQWTKFLGRQEFKSFKLLEEHCSPSCVWRLDESGPVFTNKYVSSYNSSNEVSSAPCKI